MCTIPLNGNEHSLQENESTRHGGGTIKTRSSYHRTPQTRPVASLSWLQMQSSRPSTLTVTNHFEELFTAPSEGPRSTQPPLLLVTASVEIWPSTHSLQPKTRETVSRPVWWANKLLGLLTGIRVRVTRVASQLPHWKVPSQLEWRPPLHSGMGAFLQLTPIFYVV